MSVRGPEALASIEDALRDIRREEDDLSRRLARSAERLGKFRETESELFRQLARIRLAPDVQAEMDTQLSHAEAEARGMLTNHNKNLESAEARLEDLEADLSRLAAVRAEAAADLATRRAELTALAQKVEASVRQQPDYQRAEARARELRAIAAQSLGKTAQAETDEREKGQPYRDDPLFMYLWENGYGTTEYRAGNVTRMLDGMVARHIGFAEARPNYVMLGEIPKRLREHAAYQQDAAEAAEAELAQLEQQAIERAGGGPIQEAVAEIEAHLAQIDDDIVDAEDQRDDAANTLSGLAEGADPAFEQALELLATGLRREDVKALLADARKTTTGHDDTIVAQIDDIRARAKDEDTEARQYKERLRVLAARRRELEDIQWEFKKSRFDDPRSSFKEDKLVGDMLNDFLRGTISAASYWEHWQRSQNWSGGDWSERLGGPLPKTREPAKNSESDWPEASFGGGRTRRRRTGLRGGFGGGWGAPGGTSGPSGGRPGSSGTRGHTGFKTGGGF
ncbi:hypothetical protein GCM10007989_30220 [Devosia pacifica]|uniref:Chromosome partition protein Smc n=1 Tax=Devosia pacifica TaxID=1335967 RepID=A0A918S9U6_9HYPH|nr:hypothetical protein [Devosia pacifica]GHA32109.1 hypothetical protein GCM10007989_30220 [Devosia pacifica]